MWCCSLAGTFKRSDDVHWVRLTWKLSSCPNSEVTKTQRIVPSNFQQHYSRAKLKPSSPSTLLNFHTYYIWWWWPRSKPPTSTVCWLIVGMWHKIGLVRIVIQRTRGGQGEIPHTKSTCVCTQLQDETRRHKQVIHKVPFHVNCYPRLPSLWAEFFTTSHPRDFAAIGADLHVPRPSHWPTQQTSRKMLPKVEMNRKEIWHQQAKQRSWPSIDVRSKCMHHHRTLVRIIIRAAVPSCPEGAQEGE